MDVGVCLPTNIADLKPGRLQEWAQRAESLGFSTLATTDRLISDRFEPLTALTAAAAVTSKIRLLTAVLISPLQPSAVMLAKQVATLDQLSLGRLTLGVGVGSRETDYEVAGASFQRRGRDLNRQIKTLRAVWNGELGVGPAPYKAGGPDIIIGGHSQSALNRVARTDGWLAAAAAGSLRETLDQLLQTWSKVGRQGRPRIVVLGSFSLGSNAKADAVSALTYSYGERAEAMLPGVPLDASTLQEFVSRFEAEGCDELILSPCSQKLEQLDLVAAAAAQVRS